MPQVLTASIKQSISKLFILRLDALSSLLDELVVHKFLTFDQASDSSPPLFWIVYMAVVAMHLYPATMLYRNLSLLFSV